MYDDNLSKTIDKAHFNIFILQAFRKHQQVDPLISPGAADLTADVDFSYIRNAVIDKAVTFGPVSQSYFLRNMGIDMRLKVRGV